ncbi:ubiquitin thiolesterase [Exophiala viscosa]|uniref:ubiquitinyl hydrolase 1 n=1 Tax=Exophiala viscosa TaxID=2486360 RepID=A0AAN6DW37_9EURO|nr:ubiquitin thiolesterase [Exophiala viscosa]
MAGVQGNIRSFIAPIKGSGRTAPALHEDLSLYEPWQQPQDGPNLLADSPLRFIQTQYLGDLIPLTSCRHKFGLKPKQSNPAVLDERPGPQTIWTVAAFCQVCRLHLQVKVDYTIRFQEPPCPNDDHPLHHLVRSEYQEPLERNAWLRQNPESRDEVYTYKCSSKTCSATVTVRLSPPVLRPSDVRTLVDADLLQQRTKDAFREREGNTEGMKHPGPVDVLTDLRAYIKNSWKAREDVKYRSINLSNRRFIVRFGPEGNACKDVLEHLGFQLVPGEYWRVPQPVLEDSQPFQSPVNIWLDNAENEILSLLLSLSSEERQQLPDISPPVPAERELSRILGCQDYDSDPSSRAAKPSPEMRTAPFIALGCPRDLADHLIVKAYHWQVETDPQNAPIYLSHLRYVSNDRQSDVLETEVVIETSKGRFDSETLEKAYKTFQLSGREGAVNDEDIIGTFMATLADSPGQEHDLREYLRIIGVHRNSKLVMDTAQNIMDSYEQALIFLGVDATTEDEFIQAAFTAKTSENKALEQQAIQAVRLIAQHRKSSLLSTWIDSGFSAETQMDPAEGYQALQIQNREIDDEMIMLQYNMAVEENPASVEYYNKALAAIASGRNSTQLLDHLQSRAPQPPAATEGEPVGLENIGNTCYLNSLLQVLFTMTELRRVVLDFDQYRMTLDPESMEQKRVGQRKVSLKEVQTAQKFVDRLASLFRGMIETPQSSIKPEQELARLTLETESVKERMRRRSTLMSDRPSLGHIDSIPMLGPLTLAEHERVRVTDDVIVQSPTEGDNKFFDPLVRFEEPESKRKDNNDNIEPDVEDITMNDNSSEATLVSKPDSDQVLLENPSEGQQQPVSDDKENLSPIKPSPSVTTSLPHNVEPLAPASPSKLNAQAGANELSAVPQEVNTEPEPVKYEPPPGKPPPVPPRKPNQTPTTTLEEYARQQDVTEVMNHCIIQLSCAMRPRGYDKSGEQYDEVHDLFFGQQVVHVQPEKGPSPNVPFLNIITRVYHQPPDVYAAMDNEYDLQDAQDGTKAYTSVARLPPVLTIALDRVAWNQEAKRQEKLNYHVDVPETIYMDRYLESASDSDLMHRRQQTWEMKKELAALSVRRTFLEEKHGTSKDVPGLLEDAKLVLEYLAEVSSDSVSEDLSVNPTVVADLGVMAENARAELEGIKSRMDHLNQQIKEAFVDMRKHPYRLHAAFFHRGGAAGGHYWVYIFDHKKEVWRKYNDDRVSVVQNRNEIFGKPTQDQWGPPPNPYLLIYIQADRIDDLAETVKRDIVYPPPDAPPPVPARNQMSEMPPKGDVEMLGYVNGGEQAQTTTAPDPYPYDLDISHPETQSGAKKEGDWDNSELIIPDRPVNW